MCLRIGIYDDGENAYEAIENQLKIAKVDNIVYKRLIVRYNSNGTEQCYYSPLRGFEYKKGETYSCDLGTSVTSHCIVHISNVNQGFHAYTSKEIAKKIGKVV